MNKRIYFILGYLLGWLVDWYILITREPVRQSEDGSGPQHIDGPDCWCRPTLFFDGGDEFGNVWVHKGNGEELPPSNILASAVADAISGKDPE